MTNQELKELGVEVKGLSKLEEGILKVNLSGTRFIIITEETFLDFMGHLEVLERFEDMVFLRDNKEKMINDYV